MDWATDSAASGRDQPQQRATGPKETAWRISQFARHVCLRDTTCNQKLDTVVSEDEIADYYEQNKEEFQLRNTMVRAAYVILKDDCKQKGTFQTLMNDPDTLLLQNLDVLSAYYAEKSHLDVDQWMRLDELTNIIPMKILNPESFLKRNRFICLDSDDFTYMVRFEEYLLEESLSPLAMQRDNIRSIILTQRNQQLIENMKRINED